MATVRRTIRRTVTWRPDEVGGQPLDIGRLVSPLRYDVVVRAEFFRFLDAHLDRYRADFPAFSRQAREEPYFTWFEQIAMARFRPWVVKDRRLLLEQYDERLRRSHDLWVSFREGGFDPRYPISVRQRQPQVPIEGGLQLQRSLNVGDGCHRLALLLAGGQRHVPPQLYRIQRSPNRVGLDNTAVLVRALDLDEHTYARFLSLGYADREFDDLEALARHVRERVPGSFDDLAAVIAAHNAPWWESVARRLDPDV